MNPEEIIKKMENKKFFKKVTNSGKGLLGLIDPSFKRFNASSNKKMVRQELLHYYKPEVEDTHTGFGEYGIFASIVNEAGEKELDAIKNNLKENGLFDNISNLRYESQEASGGCLVDGFNDNDEDLVIRSFSTSNVYVYALTSSEKSRKLKNLKTVVSCMHPKLGRNIYPIENF